MPQLRDLSRLGAASAHLFIACLPLCGVSSATPSITLSKKTGPPTSQILVSGTGFKGNATVAVYFDTVEEASIVTNSTGGFSNAAIRAPRAARPGQHWISALETDDGQGAQDPFLVNTNWPQFHYSPDHEGLNPYENLLSPSSVGHLTLRWKQKTGSYVGSSAAVVNGAIYISSLDKYLYSLNASTGALLWKNNNPASNGYSSPVVIDDVVYESGVYTFALNAHTGALLWSYDTKDNASSPVVSDGVVYVGANFNLYALNAHTGAPLWSFHTESWTISAPTIADGLVYISSQDGYLYALDPRTGAEVWKYYIFGGISSPTIADGVIYVGGGTNIYALSASTGTLLWTYSTGGSVVSSPAVTSGVVFVGSEDYNVYALNAMDGVLRWTFPTSYGVYSSPAVANGVVYVGSDDKNVYALDGSTGALLWRYTTGSQVQSAPSVANGMVYVGSADDNVYAFSLPGADAVQENPADRPDLRTLFADLTLQPSNSTASPPR